MNDLLHSIPTCTNEIINSKNFLTECGEDEELLKRSKRQNPVKKHPLISGRF